MDVSKLGRREFLRFSSLAGAGVLVAACQPQVVEKVVEKVVKETVVVAGTPQTVERVVTTTPVPSTKGSLQMWVMPFTENDAKIVYDPVLAKFYDEYPDIKVTVDVIPWGGRREKLYTASAAGAPPDVWLASTDTLPTYVARGVIAPIEELLDPEDWAKADYTDADLGLGTFKGRFYAPPWYAYVGDVAYNGALWSEIGWDTEKGVSTFDDYLALGEACRSNDWYAQRILTMSWGDWLAYVHMSGGTVYSEDRTTNYMTEQPAIDSLNFWVQMFENGYVPKEFAVSTPEASQGLPDYWAEGKELVRIADASNCVSMKQQQPDFQWIMGHPRTRAEGDPLTAGVAGGALWGITSGSKAKDAGAAYVSFLIRPDNIGLVCTMVERSPAGRAAKAYWKAEACMKESVEFFSEFAFANQDNTTLWQESKTTCGPHFAAAVLGEETVEEALDGCQKELQVLLDKMNA